jgi:Na+-transporting NADH:ubiquinone oxidoreductase subunit NqrD
LKELEKTEKMSLLAQSRLEMVTNQRQIMVLSVAFFVSLVVHMISNNVRLTVQLFIRPFSFLVDFDVF